ncbi:unnamed protein product [Pleuronectes platessa]|uniref:Uncharacterized protein n=1 Tax=Pleuronectes platessa TaxID=8262 RepID=A0A9N7UVG2_PLEPL|nr:unnamed protein product [Pleuronectes platessa]
MAAARPLHIQPHSDSPVSVCKRWSAAGRRPSRGVSCSCGNLCDGTIERAPFSRSPAPAHSAGEWRATHHNNNSALLSSREKSPMEALSSSPSGVLHTSAITLINWSDGQLSRQSLRRRSSEWNELVSPGLSEKGRLCVSGSSLAEASENISGRDASPRISLRLVPTTAAKPT